MFPVIPFYSSNYLNAFILNSAVVTSAACFAAYFRDREKGEKLATIAYGRIFLVTFLTTFGVYLLFFFLFRYGGGLLSSQKDREISFAQQYVES